MVRTLFSFYVRAGIGAANLALRVAARSVDLASDAVRIAVPSSAQPVRGESDDVFGRQVEPAPPPPGEVDYDRDHDRDYDRATPQLLDQTSDKAKTIDEQPELVAEVAEPGAEDGASAAVEVDEPWDGYDKLTADQVIARIGDADAAELAVVELYEHSHKERSTVLAAAERRQRELANAP